MNDNNNDEEMNEWQTVSYRKNSKNNSKQKNRYDNKLSMKLLSIYLGLKSSYILDDSDQLLLISSNEIGECIYDVLNLKSYSIDMSAINIRLVYLTCRKNQISIAIHGNIKHMIVNMKSMLDNLNIWINNENSLTNLINVSANIDEPQVVCSKSKGNDQVIMRNLEYLLEFLIEKFSIYENTKNISEIGIDLDELDLSSPSSSSDYYWDLCAIQGIILGYPIIYCCQTINDGNCLSNIVLHNFSVKMKKFCDKNTEKCIELYSFTIPEMFINEFNEKITEWYKNLSNKILNIDANKIQLIMDEKLQCYPLILT